MKRIAVLFLIISLAYGYNPNEVDYWGTNAKKEVNKEKKKEKEIVSGEKILDESKKWYEEKLKREQPPIVYYYFKNPQKYKKYAREWIEWLGKKSKEIILPQVAYARGEEVNIYQAIKELKRRGYVLLYFYNKDCSACKLTTPEIDSLSLKMRVYKIEIHEKPEMFLKWRIKATPTTIAVSRKEKRAYRYEGAFMETGLISYFYSLIRGEKK